MLKEVLLENKEVVKKTILLLQVNLVDPSKVEVVYHTSIELASLFANEKERLEVETSEGSETVFIEHEVADKIVGNDKRR